MPFRLLASVASTALIFLSLPSAASAIVLGQIDDFQDGTPAHWGYAPVAVVNGGAAGENDKFLQVTSTGGTGPDGYLRVNNGSQWAGDYVSAGVTAIAVDLRNSGNVDLQIRASVFSQGGGGFASAMAYLLPADGHWHHVVFGLTAADLTLLGAGNGSLDWTLQHNAVLSLYHDPGPPDRLGTPVAAQLGIDNVRAVPEPASLALLAFGGCVLLRKARPRKS